MGLQEVPLAFALLGLVLYTVLAGADFGAGIWQLAAGHRHEPVRKATTAAGMPCAKPAATGSRPLAKPAWPTVEPQPETNHDREPLLVGYFQPDLLPGFRSWGAAKGPG